LLASAVEGIRVSWNDPSNAGGKISTSPSLPKSICQVLVGQKKQAPLLGPGALEKCGDE